MNVEPGKSKGIVKRFLFLLIPVVISCNTSIDYSEFKGPSYEDNYEKIWEPENYEQWGVYNIHDPACIKYGEYYYLYSTDAIFFKEPPKQEDFPVEMGNVQVRRSKDLINWEFIGWALDTIPADAVHYLDSVSGGLKPVNVWAPYVIEWNGKFRLYYAVSLFGAKTSYIGLAESSSPEGPWKLKGGVVKSDNNDKMNAIDASVIADKKTGRHWMHYGSYFGGLFCVELNPETGFALKEGDKGHLIARRAEYKTKNLEAPEIVYNSELDEYFLFTSYDALFSHYNVRVGRSKTPEGPFFDYFGKDLADTTDNYPILTYAYRFAGHPGWAGVAHCGVMNDNEKYFMFHQGRLAPDNLMMILHVREIFWNSDGWPVVSPQRYAGVPSSQVKPKEIPGKWELISLNEVHDTVVLWQGQIPPGGWYYDTTMYNNPVIVQFNKDGSIDNLQGYEWEMQQGSLIIKNATDTTETIVSHGWDWENKKTTIVLTGIKTDGIGLYGKKI